MHARQLTSLNHSSSYMTSNSNISLLPRSELLVDAHSKPLQVKVQLHMNDFKKWQVNNKPVTDDCLTGTCGILNGKQLRGRVINFLLSSIGNPLWWPFNTDSKSKIVDSQSFNNLACLNHPPYTWKYILHSQYSLLSVNQGNQSQLTTVENKLIMSLEAFCSTNF